MRRSRRSQNGSVVFERPDERREHHDHPRPTCASGRTSRGEECDAEEDEQGADTHPDEDPRSSRGPARTGPAQRGEAERRQQDRARGPESREPRLRQRRALADGGDRRHASRPDRRPQAGDERDEDADERETTIVLSGREPAVRQREADLVEQPEEALREPEPEQQPDERCEHADDERFDHDRPQNLAAGARRSSAASRTLAFAARS